MIRELVRLATHLDSKGYAKEASHLDSVIRKMAEEGESWDDALDVIGIEPSDEELSSIDEGDLSVGDIFTPQEDRLLSDLEYDGPDDITPSSLSALLGEEMPEHIYNADDTRAFGRGIEKSPDATAQFFFDNYNAYADAPNASSLAQFARTLLERIQRDDGPHGREQGRAVDAEREPYLEDLDFNV